MTAGSGQGGDPPGELDRTETLRGEQASEPTGSATSLDGGRFAPGTMLDGRYRVVALLGRGGMGEVYRAEDLRLGETVALKFLPQELATDGAALARFHAEVRTARGITHKNVVRVHDLTEIDGRPFLSMEFVEGEDLASLLKRIGRLPQDKAIELARQICAGLAAAHERGFLHRDLKPANVMIDHDGQAKINDFGLAGLATDLEEVEHAGTPAYMAPEQLTEGKVSFASDLFSLGLVLYEMFAGRRAFEAKSREELVRRYEEGVSDNLSSHVSGIEPRVEAIIQRCLAARPEERPRSALEVAAALPGGDPLAAALAAGETPSPEMVARSRIAGALRPWVGTAVFATLVLTVAATAFFRDRASWTNVLELPKPPAVLEDRARSLVADLGYEIGSSSTYWGFRKDLDYFAWLREEVPAEEWMDRARVNQPGLVGFWLAATTRPARQRFPGWNYFDPLRPGDLRILLDPEGRLLEFAARPASLRLSDQPLGSSVDWDKVFEEAGLELRAFSSAEPERMPAVFVDERRSWRGRYPQRADIALRVEASAFDGRLAEFALFPPWRDLGATGPTSAGSLAGLWVMLSILIPTILVLAFYLVRRNLKSGRGDRKGAFRLAAFVFGATTLGLLLGMPHTGGPVALMVLMLREAGTQLLIAILFWAVYIAFEPALRRRWPAGMVSWTRLLSGDFRDPLVGRDALLGAATAGLACSAFWAIAATAGGQLPDADWFFAHEGLRGAFGALFTIQIAVPLFNAFQRVFVFTLLLLVLRRRPLAIVGIVLVAFGEYLAVVGLDSPTDALIACVMAAGIAYPVAFLGVTATVAYWFVFFLLNSFPALSLDFSGWQAGLNLFIWALTLGFGFYGYRTATAGKPLFD